MQRSAAKSGVGLDLGETELRTRLADAATATAPWRAAVLVPLVRESDGWHLLFIRRAERADDAHSGQVAFPGGRMDPADDGPVACALRETHEEIGVAAERVEVLGAGTVRQTRAGYPVQPVIGLVPWPTVLRPDPREVAHCFTMPLAWLADPANQRPVRYRAADGAQAWVPGYRHYRGEHLWGLTARIVLDVLARLTMGAAAPAPRRQPLRRPPAAR
jgi:8-oxo-dGTP pyrophosphatase MutT (NUDIX family)